MDMYPCFTPQIFRLASQAHLCSHISTPTLMRCLRDNLRLTLWDMHRNVDILKETGELPVEEQLRQRRLQWLGHVQRMPGHCPQKQLLRCRPQGKRRSPCGTLLQWIDVISRDLVGVTNWQEVVKDRVEWRAAVRQPKPVIV